MHHALKVLLVSGAAIGMATASFAADLIIAPIMSPTPVAGWEGLYLGGNVGFASGTSDHVANAIGDLTMSGGLFGAQVGYNFPLASSFVIGIQGDLDFANVTGTYTGGPTITQTINWEGSVTGHFGYDAGVFMPYVLGGLTAVGTTRTSSIGPISESAMQSGYTVGAGVNFKATDDISLFIEGRYNGLGSHTYTTLPSSPVVALSSTEFRAGLNWHF